MTTGSSTVFSTQVGDSLSQICSGVQKRGEKETSSVGRPEHKSELSQGKRYALTNENQTCSSKHCFERMVSMRISTRMRMRRMTMSNGGKGGA